MSSAANDLNADLSSQNAVNVAGIRNQADTAAGDLRSQVNTEEQKAVSQLYATEDPEVAAQQSLASVRDISLSQPQMSPLSALFNVASIGGANVAQGLSGPAEPEHVQLVAADCVAQQQDRRERLNFSPSKL